MAFAMSLEFFSPDINKYAIGQNLNNAMGLFSWDVNDFHSVYPFILGILNDIVSLTVYLPILGVQLFKAFEIDVNNVMTQERPSHKLLFGSLIGLEILTLALQIRGVQPCKAFEIYVSDVSTNGFNLKLTSSIVKKLKYSRNQKLLN